MHGTADAGIVAILDQPAAVPIDRFYGDPLYNKETMGNRSITLRRETTMRHALSYRRRGLCSTRGGPVPTTD